MRRTAMTKLTKIWNDRDITKNFKVQLIKTLILLYAAETWTIRKAEADHINVFEMWAYRRIL